MMKFTQTLIAPVVAVSAAFVSYSQAAEVPAALSAYFEKDAPVRAQIVMVSPPKEFDTFAQKMSEAAQKDPEWFAAHTAKTPGNPIPEFDEKLGISQEEYDAYVKLWEAREVEKIAETTLILTETANGQWKINGAGPASVLSLLSYDAAKNVFISPNGELESIADVAAPAQSILGAWTGKEWRYQASNALTTAKENVALGTTADGKFCYLVYRLQEVSAKGSPLFDQSMLIRFAAKSAK